MRIFTLGRSLLLGALVLAGVAAPAFAQDGMPEGVTLEVFANGIAASVPQEASQILLLEVGWQPEATWPVTPDAQAVALVAVRTGELTGTLDTDIEIGRHDAAPGQTEEVAAKSAFTLAEGDSALVPAGAVGELKAGDAATSALLFVAAPAMRDNGDDMADMPEGVTVTPLAAGDTPKLDGPALIWLGQFTLKPGAAFPGQAQPGAELGAGTAGEFTMKTTGGPGVVVLKDFATAAAKGEQPEVTETKVGDTVTFGPGDAVFFPDGNTVDISNEGDTDAITLFGGIGPLPAE
ncbi:MAG: hypothetical protein QM692_07085 [Thermomicrobiales bacterium]